jgi:hypothetical protein
MIICRIIHVDISTIHSPMGCGIKSKNTNATGILRTKRAISASQILSGDAD